MNMMYNVLEKVVPFQWISYDFMKNALLAVLIITPLFALLGTMIVNQKMAFFSEALGHSAYTGIGIGVLFGVADKNVSMLAFAVIFALGLNRINRKNTVSTDTIISVFSSLGTALGLVILSSGGNFSKYSNLLVGDVLSITHKEISLLAAVFVLALLFWFFAFNKLHAISINASLAKSKGVRVELIEDIFSVLIAVIIMFSIRWVGILIINALLILPAASSRNISDNMREYHLYSVVISVFSGILGLVLSYYNNTATGPTIVLVASVVFFLTLFAKPLVK
ncbi:metal ABC transporter permease [[Clostridium] polysaccharolyticum]|jgi:zinc transport system permease protein|uniref:Zinc transport system permease protein n=1 Tax=[Clostridium] polysaccharolyticum TaxID=29364 RepID=A0A1H9YL26_9FIRM|nr:metal ABC transporter permease [[Clostridium] polysaccharolyticum]SES69753.1 zinc transport system permease protein [[Clostridium] polysaccharolyticum]